ncbi:hypothetical protein ABZ897_51075 [Nonomuraea sp. NPDC046802]|uniref:hypothetical protein n=1 Tax=Nonomuraea sp. NPDC046802 TaxID=3154919 RepID=UPI0033C58B14
MIRYADPSRIAAFAAEVAQHLPDQFEVQTFPQKVQSYRKEQKQDAVVLVNGDERIALLHRKYSESDDRITFMALCLTADLSDSGSLSHELGTYTTAALTRSPKAVAAQICRNILPYYRTQLDSQRRMEAQRAARRALREAEAERIAALLPGGQYIPSGTNRFYDSELINFSGPGVKGSLSVYSDRDGLTYSLTFGQDDAFCADLIALIRKHSG